MSTTTLVATPVMPFGTAVEKFLALRDRKAAIEKRHKDELVPFNLAMAKLEGIMLDTLNANGVDSMRAADIGTAYKTTRTSTKVTDWNQTLEFIRTKELWELLEARVSKTAAEAIMSETQAPIPGVTTSRETVIGVRRA